MMQFSTEYGLMCAVQDVMAIVRHVKHPDIFWQWPQIQSGRRLWKTCCQARLQLCVLTWWHMSSRASWKVCWKNWGKARSSVVLINVVAKLHVIKFQKRGLPQAHILISFAAEDNMRGFDDFDSIVSAQLPDKQTHPLLYALVCKHMLHKQCGKDLPNAACMRDGRCRFDYPMPFAEETNTTDDAYPQYGRYAIANCISEW